LHRLGRDIFGALQVAHYQQLVLFSAGGERKPAVAHYYAGNPVPARTGAERIPEHLRIHVGMRIDKPGRDDVPVGVDSLARVFADLPDGRYLAVGDSDVTVKPRHAAALNNCAIANN